VSGGLLLLPNVGAEEGEAAPGPDVATRRVAPQLDAVARLWHLLFAADTAWLDANLPPPAYPPALGAWPDGAAFPWLESPDGVTAWLNTEAAERRAAAAGRDLSGASPAAVARVHDKAFAHAAACSEGLLPSDLEHALAVLEPAALRDADAAVARISAELARWPAWARRRFTLKPRFGSSGRGRVAGRDGEADTPALRGALPRLAERGGALLEPWLERSEDLSASLWLSEGGELVLLGTTRQWLAPSGLYLGQRGSLDSKGRVTSDSDRDERLREAAATVARAAGAEGFFGPCGLDAFVYRNAGGDEVFRPVVEWNARFTLGAVAIGLVRRALRVIAKAFDLAPGRRLAFHFGLDAPAAGWPQTDASLLVLPLWRDGDEVRPALVVAESRETLERILGGRAA
jgi:hypothetical protein